jgi:hypothetical protein
VTQPHFIKAMPAIVVGTIPTAQNHARLWRVIEDHQQTGSISEECPSDGLQIVQGLCELPNTKRRKVHGREQTACELAVIQVQ